MSFPRGIIVEWAFGIETIPTGFVLCDGNNGTPDLRDRFVVGAGTTYDPDDSGGATNHTHPFTTDGHSHFHQAGSDIAFGNDISRTDDLQTDSGTTNPANHLPPYYALAYIMKT